jgi:hypothetical protein
VTNNKAEAMAWAVWCPPRDECDFLVCYTPEDAEQLDDEYKNSVASDEEDAERRTPGVVPLYPAPPAGHIMESDGTVRKATPIYWPEDADGENGLDDLDCICDAVPLGEVFEVQVAYSIEPKHFVNRLDERGCNDPRPATPEEVAEFKAVRKAEIEARKAKWAAEAAQRAAGGGA